MSLILEANNFDTPLVWAKAAIHNDVSSISWHNYKLHKTSRNFIETEVKRSEGELQNIRAVTIEKRMWIDSLV